MSADGHRSEGWNVPTAAAHYATFTDAALAAAEAELDELDTAEPDVLVGRKAVRIERARRDAGGTRQPRR